MLLHFWEAVIQIKIWLQIEAFGLFLYSSRQIPGMLIMAGVISDHSSTALLCSESSLYSCLSTALLLQGRAWCWAPGERNPRMTPRVHAVQNVGETGWYSVNRLPEPPPEAWEAELDNICCYFMLEGMGFCISFLCECAFTINTSKKTLGSRILWWRSMELVQVKSWDTCCLREPCWKWCRYSVCELWI